MQSSLNIISQNSNNNNCFYNNDLKYQINPMFLNNNSIFEINPSLNRKRLHIVKKRSYNELLEEYKKRENDIYKKENKELLAIINMNFEKNINKLKINFQNGGFFVNEQNIINNIYEKKRDIKNEEKKNKKLINEKNYMIVDDDDVELCSENIEKTCDYKKKKNKLNFVKYFEEDKGYDEDLEDKKKCSGFNSVNINYSHPKLCIDNYDNYIKTKIIANVIQSEKAFNKYFNIKTIPNK